MKTTKKESVLPENNEKKKKKRILPYQNINIIENLRTQLYYLYLLHKDLICIL